SPTPRGTLHTQKPGPELTPEPLKLALREISEQKADSLCALPQIFKSQILIEVCDLLLGLVQGVSHTLDLRFNKPQCQCIQFARGLLPETKGLEAQIVGGVFQCTSFVQNRFHTFRPLDRKSVV